MTAIETAYRESWRPPDRRPIYESLKDDLVFGNESPFPGGFDINNSPWIKEPLDKISEDIVKRVLVSGGAQLAKTLLGLIFVISCIKRRPGLTTWNGQTDDAIKKICEDKAWPLFRRSKMINELLPRDANKRRIKSIVFPHMSLRFQSASENNAHGDTVKNQVNDERHLWLPGMIHKFKSRVGSMPDHKILDLSTGSVKLAEQFLEDGTLLELGDDFFNDFHAGSRSIWSVHCPKCGDQQPLVMTHRDANNRILRNKKGDPQYGFVWEDNSTTRPGGRWNYAEVARTVRWHCVHCGHEIPDSYDNILALNSLENGAGYVVTNTLHDPEIWSYRYPAWVSPIVGWGTIVKEWLRAQEAARAGDYLAVKTVIQNRFAEAWDESVTLGEDSKPTGDYDLDKWNDEEDPRFAGGCRIFMTVDRQKKGGTHFWILIRAWNDAGESRLIDYLKVFSWDEVAAKQAEYNIQGHRVLVDSGDETAEVYGQCVLHGWTALKGEDAEHFKHPNPRNPKEPILRYYSQPTKGDPVLGKSARKLDPAVRKAMSKRRYAKLYRWARGPVQDILAAFISGESHYWGRAKIEPQHYADHLDSEVKKHVRDKRGRDRAMWVQVKPDNHARDLEAMQVAALLMARILRGSMDVSEQVPKSGTHDIEEKLRAAVRALTRKQ
jgi:hypothetical protein